MEHEVWLETELKLAAISEIERKYGVREGVRKGGREGGGKKESRVYRTTP